MTQFFAMIYILQPFEACLICRASFQFSVHLLILFFLETNHSFGVLFAASPLMGAQSFPNLTTTGTTSTVTMSTSIVTSSNNVATATTGLSVGQLLSNTLTTSLTSTSSESDTGQEAEFSLYGRPCYIYYSLSFPSSSVVLLYALLSAEFFFGRLISNLMFLLITKLICSLVL